MFAPRWEVASADERGRCAAPGPPLRLAGPLSNSMLGTVVIWEGQD